METIQRGTINAEQFAALCNLFHTTHCDQIDPTAQQIGDVMLFHNNPVVCDHSRLIARAVLAYLGIRFGIPEADEIVSEVHASMRNGEGAFDVYVSDDAES